MGKVAKRIRYGANKENGDFRAILEEKKKGIRGKWKSVPRKYMDSVQLVDIF